MLFELTLCQLRRLGQVCCNPARRDGGSTLAEEREPLIAKASVSSDLINREAASGCSVSYNSEKALVDEFVIFLNYLASPWGPLRTAREFFYQRGRTDVIALAEDGRIIAFEAKLTRWRDALHQAYRNTCFAHSSYVLLPKEAALGAQRYIAEFQRRGVGLCYFGDVEGFVVLVEASDTQPLEPWLSGQAAFEVSRETTVGSK